MSIHVQYHTVLLNSPLWKRVIPWERSHAASDYGIIWGDADRNKQDDWSQRGLVLTELQIAMRSRLLF